MTEVNHNTVDAECYNEIVASASLSSIYLKDVSFSGDLSELQDQSLSFKVGSGMVAWGYSEEDAMLSGVFQYSLEGNHEDKLVIAAKAVYLVEYNVSMPCDREEGQLYLHRVGKYAAYPYFRALFASMTDQAGIAMPPLPVLTNLSRKVGDPKKILQKKRKKA